MIAPINALIRAVRERGWKGTLTQLYLIGDCKFGELKGTDNFGNKYYENVDYPFGQHRWVEYADIHNYDASMIQPEWHGWMHHMFDETPNDAPLKADNILTTNISHAIYTNHVGMLSPDREVDHPSTDVTQYRQRGYKVGSLQTGKDDADLYYRQPGHPLSPFAKRGGPHALEDTGPFFKRPEKKKYIAVDYEGQLLNDETGETGHEERPKHH